MSWHPDVPNIPIKKPKEIEKLEQMDRVFLDSMPPMEVSEKVNEIAHAVARDYKKQKTNGTFEECLEVVSVALKVTGSAIEGRVGNAMIASCDSEALKVCTILYPEM